MSKITLILLGVLFFAALPVVIRWKKDGMFRQGAFKGLNSWVFDGKRLREKRELNIFINFLLVLWEEAKTLSLYIENHSINENYGMVIAFVIYLINPLWFIGITFATLFLVSVYRIVKAVEQLFAGEVYVEY